MDCVVDLGQSAHIYFLISLRNRLIVATQWLWSYLTFERGARLITGMDRAPEPDRPVVEPMMLDPRTDKERLETPMQWGHAYVKFRNDNGVPEIRIGVKEFKCIGVSPPQDHPHIYLDMGNDDTILCPYCSTLFHFDPRLGPGEVDPPDCLFIDELGNEKRTGCSECPP